MNAPQARERTADVATLISLLKAQTIIPSRFHLSLTEDETASLLGTAYCEEVSKRRKAAILDSGTEDVIRKVASSLSTSRGTTFGMMLCGLPGNGKTTMMMAIWGTLKVCAGSGLYPKDFKTMSVFDASTVIKMASNEEGWDYLKNAPLLAIDDFGKETTEVVSYGNVSSPMIELLEYRYQRMLYTVISTNLTGAEIQNKYGRRLVDRFCEMLDIIVFKQPSWRNKKEI